MSDTEVVDLLAAIASFATLAILSYFFAPSQPLRTGAGSWAPLDVGLPGITRRGPRHAPLGRAVDPASAVLVALAIVSLVAVGAGAYALFTARTSNPDNRVATGTLTMSNSKANTAIFSAGGLRPGEGATGTVTITNSGSLDGAYTLSIANVTGGGSGSGDLSGILTVTIADELGRVVYAGDFASMPEVSLPGTDGGRWDSDEAHTYTFEVRIPLSAGNAYQDTSATAEYVWQATQ